MNGMEKEREALESARDYINDGSLLPQDMNDPYFKTSAAIDDALAALDAEKPAKDAWGVARQISDKVKASEVFNPFESACLIQSYAEAYAAKKCAAERLRTLEEVKEMLRLGNEASIAIVFDRLIADAKKAVES